MGHDVQDVFSFVSNKTFEVTKMNGSKEHLAVY